MEPIEISEDGLRRYRAVRELLFAMREVPGWVLVKAWDDPANTRGDVDLLVRPSSVKDVEESIWRFLCRHDRGRLVGFRCGHIPRVPRILVMAEQLGFEASLLEIDLATVVPFRGYPLVGFDRLARFTVRDANGVPRLTPDAASALRFLSRLGWLRTPSTPPTAAVRVVLASVSPAPLRRVWMTGLGGPWLAILDLGLLSAALIRDPKLLLERARFRTREVLRGLECPFDPRRGPDSRKVGDLDTLARRACASGHEVMISR